MVTVVSQFFFHARATRHVYVQIPSEDAQPGEEGVCGKLNYSMYGIRDAAQNWQAEHFQRLIESGFARGAASPCVFHHSERGIGTLVHGDDYVSVGHPKPFEWMGTQLKEKYKTKTQLLGLEEEHSKEIKILNWIVVWNGAKGIVYEADLRDGNCSRTVRCTRSKSSVHTRC